MRVNDVLDIFGGILTIALVATFLTKGNTAGDINAVGSNFAGVLKAGLYRGFHFVNGAAPDVIPENRMHITACLGHAVNHVLIHSQLPGVFPHHLV